MTYPLQFNNKQQETLSEFIHDVEALRPGQHLTVSHRNAQELGYRRYLLYAWLSPQHTNKKELYKITQLSRFKFQVMRRESSTADVKVSATDAEQFVMDNMLDITDSTTALELIQRHHSDANMILAISVNGRASNNAQS